MTAIPIDTLIQVRDLKDRWHAAAVGPGVLCVGGSADVTFHTVQWTYGTGHVDCPPCLRRIANLQAAQGVAA